jgi:hypothetical protein
MVANSVGVVSVPSSKVATSSSRRRIMRRGYKSSPLALSLSCWCHLSRMTLIVSAARYLCSSLRLENLILNAVIASSVIVAAGLLVSGLLKYLSVDVVHLNIWHH